MVCLNSSLWSKIRESLLHSLFHSLFLLLSKDVWDGNTCTREGEGGGGVLKNKCPYGAMYNFLGEKFSSSPDKHYIIIFGGLKPKSSCPRSFAQNLILEKQLGV